MSNLFQNPVMYTMECLRSLNNEIVLGKRVSRKYQKEFAKDDMKIGDTLNIRRPWRALISNGQSFNAQDYTETSIPLVVNSQKHVDTAFTSADMTLKEQDFSKRVIMPAMIQLGAQIDQDGYTNAKNTVGPLTGTAGTAPNTQSFLFDIGRKADNFSVPRDGERYFVMDPTSTAAQVAALTGFFQAQNLIAKQYEEGVFVDATNTIGLKIGMSQNVARHTVGLLGGSPLTNGSSQGLATGWANIGTLVTNGWTSAAAQRLNVGDNFTIAGVYGVNPVTRVATGAATFDLLQFTVVAAGSSDASGNMTISHSPALIYGGPFQNASNAAATSQALTISGSSAVQYVRNLAWYPDAFELAVVRMQDLAMFGGWGSVQSYEGFSLRTFRQAAISSDTVGNRVDALYGWATPYPEQAVQQVGA